MRKKKKITINGGTYTAYMIDSIKFGKDHIATALLIRTENKKEFDSTDYVRYKYWPLAAIWELKGFHCAKLPVATSPLGTPATDIYIAERDCLILLGRLMEKSETEWFNNPVTVKQQILTTQKPKKKPINEYEPPTEWEDDSEPPDAE